MLKPLVNVFLLVLVIVIKCNCAEEAVNTTPNEDLNATYNKFLSLLWSLQTRPNLFINPFTAPGQLVENNDAGQQDKSGAKTPAMTVTVNQSPPSGTPSDTEISRVNPPNTFDVSTRAIITVPNNPCPKDQKRDWQGNCRNDEYFNEFAEITSKLSPREEWGAKPPTRAPTDRPMFHPVRYILLTSFHTKQEKPTRAEIMQELQRRDMQERGLTDIQCNWAIGEDGLVFEGRTWMFRPGNSHKYPRFEGRYAEFTFIGNYKDQRSRKAAMQFIRLSQIFQYLRKDLRLLEDLRFLKK